MKKFAVILIILVLCTLIGLWSPWRSINIDLPQLFGISKQDLKSGLQVYSLSGNIQIYVDNQLKGEVTPEESPYFVDNIDPGQHLIKLERKSEKESAYWTFNKLVTFEKGTNVVVSYNLGPSEVFSEGHIIYAVNKDYTKTETSINVLLNINEFNIQFDSLPIEKISFNEYSSLLDLTRQHSIKLSKPGFEQLEFVILPSSQEERDKLKNYNIMIEAHLMYQPVNVEDIIQNPTEQSTQEQIQE